MVSSECMKLCAHKYFGYSSIFHLYSQLLRCARGSEFSQYFSPSCGLEDAWNLVLNALEISSHCKRELWWVAYHLADVDCSAMSMRGTLCSIGTFSSTLVISVFTACIFERVGYSLTSVPIQLTLRMLAHLLVLISYPPCYQSSHATFDPRSELWTLLQLTVPPAVGLM